MLIGFEIIIPCISSPLSFSLNHLILVFIKTPPIFFNEEHHTLSSLILYLLYLKVYPWYMPNVKIFKVMVSNN